MALHKVVYYGGVGMGINGGVWKFGGPGAENGPDASGVGFLAVEGIKLQVNSTFWDMGISLRAYL